MGREYLSQGDAMGAFYWYSRYVKHAPNSNEKADAYFTLALISVDAGDAMDAGGYCIETIKCLPSFKEAYELLAALSTPDYRKYWKAFSQFADNYMVLFTRKREEPKRKD